MQNKQKDRKEGQVFLVGKATFALAAMKGQNSRKLAFSGIEVI
jgi:hypothetical protein